jgi:hypothetical protein
VSKQLEISLVNTLNPLVQPRLLECLDSHDIDFCDSSTAENGFSATGAEIWWLAQPRQREFSSHKERPSRILGSF